MIARYVFSFLHRLSTGLAVVVGFSVFVLAFLITFDVIARKYFGFSLQGTDEIGGYIQAAVASLGFSYVLFERGFTRIDLLIKRANSTFLGFLNVLAYVTLAAVAVFFAQRALATYGDTLLFDARANTPLQTPMWIPQGIWAVGMAFFAICAVLYALRAVALFFTDPKTLEKEFGIVTLEEEVSEIAELSMEANATAGEEKRP